MDKIEEIFEKLKKDMKELFARGPAPTHDEALAHIDAAHAAAVADPAAPPADGAGGHVVGAQTTGNTSV